MKPVKLKLLISLNPKEVISITIVYALFIRKSSVRCRSSAVQTLVLIPICSSCEYVFTSILHKLESE